jgi:hypothetical protein
LKDGGGQATFKTVQGEPMTITEKGRAFDIRPHRPNHDRRRSPIERRDPCHQQGFDVPAFVARKPRVALLAPVDLIETREHDLRDAEAARLA